MKGRLCLLFINIKISHTLKGGKMLKTPTKPYMGAIEIPCMILSQGLINVVQKKFKAS
jgi:hypothetical protein